MRLFLLGWALLVIGTVMGFIACAFFTSGKMADLERDALTLTAQLEDAHQRLTKLEARDST